MPENCRANLMRKLIIPNEPLFDEICRLLDANKQVTFLTKGNSMLPFIRGGEDSVVLQKRQVYKKGDIVLFKTNGRYILHRILRIEGTSVTLMGDGNLSGKEHCHLKDIFGKVLQILPPGKEPVNCNTLLERRKAQIWLKLLPIRRYLLGIYRRLYKTNQKP